MQFKYLYWHHINTKNNQYPVTSASFTGNCLPCGEDVLPGRLQMHFVITNIHCPVFPTCYMCYLPLVTHITPVPKAVCPHYSHSYIRLKYFYSQFQWTMVARKIKFSSFFPIAVTAINKSFLDKKRDKIRILNFVLPKFNIRNLLLSCIMLSQHCGEELRD